MPYDEGLAELVRLLLQDISHHNEKKMFGGLCFLINGNMACGIVGDKLMVRIGRDNYKDALMQEYVEEMDFTGKPMRGMIYIDEEGSQIESVLQKWVDEGKKYAKSLPPK